MTLTVADLRGDLIDDGEVGKGDRPRSDRVGAEYRVASCDLGVLMQEAAEPVSSGDLDVGVDGIG